MRDEQHVQKEVEMMIIYLSGRDPFVESEFQKYGFKYKFAGGLMSYVSAEGRKEFSPGKNFLDMLNASLFVAVEGGTRTLYEMGYFKALTDNLKYIDDDNGDHERYTVLYSPSTKLGTEKHFSVDAHVIGETQMQNFCGIVAGNWDEPDDAWNAGRRKKIFGQFRGTP
tara:strand:- start:1921 stop:2424 length:504 start_codon:yes stop_codon:yes gene_type:complete